VQQVMRLLAMNVVRTDLTRLVRVTAPASVGITSVSQGWDEMPCTTYSDSDSGPRVVSRIRL